MTNIIYFEIIADSIRIMSAQMQIGKYKVCKLIQKKNNWSQL